MQDEADQDPLAEAARDIEAFAKLATEFAQSVVDKGQIAPAFVPEALLLAAVELAARHEEDAAGIADWLMRVAERLREHVEPESGSVQ